MGQGRHTLRSSDPVYPRNGKGRARAEWGDRVGKGEGGSTWIFVQGTRVPSYATARDQDFVLEDITE